MTPNLQPPETETDHLAGWMGHLVELRTRIVRASVAVLVVFLILFYWRNQIFGFFSAPMLASSIASGIPATCWQMRAMMATLDAVTGKPVWTWEAR